MPNNKKSYVNWGDVAIGSGTTALGALLFNRFILGNKSWKSHAIASAIGATLGGGGTALYEYLDGVIDSKKDKKTKRLETLMKDKNFREKVEAHANKPGWVRDLGPYVNLANAPVYGAAGHLAGSQADRIVASALGRRPASIQVLTGNGSQDIKVSYSKLGGGPGVLDSSDIAKLDDVGKANLVDLVDKNKMYDIKLTKQQLDNAALLGNVQNKPTYKNPFIREWDSIVDGIKPLKTKAGWRNLPKNVLNSFKSGRGFSALGRRAGVGFGVLAAIDNFMERGDLEEARKRYYSE